MSEAVGAEAFEPLPAAGEGGELFDAPSLFYLTHQEAIDEWARLREVAIRVTNEWLSTVMPPRLEQLAATMGFTLSHRPVSQGEAWILLHPPKMPIHDGRPILAIGLAWFPTSINLATTGVWAGVRVETGASGVGVRELFLQEAQRHLEPADGWKLSGDASWPTYRYLNGVQRWWTDLDRCRERLADEVGATTNRFRDSVVAVLDRLRGMGQA